MRYLKDMAPIYGSPYTASCFSAVRRVLPLVAMLLLGVRAGAAQDPSHPVAYTATAALPIDVEAAARPAARAARTSEPIVLDGQLDEPAWKAAEPLTNFVQSRPRQGYPATEPTVVRVLYDDERIYFGVVAFDSHPSRLTTTSLDRDFPAGDNDVVSIAIDPYLSRKDGYVFSINPAGAVADIQSFDDLRNFNQAWDGIVEVRTAVSDSAWTFEMAIPWKTLRTRGSPGEQSWGLNVLRRVRRTNEISFWAPLDRREVPAKFSRAGTLTGLAGLPTPRNLTMKPYVAAARLASDEPSSADRQSLNGGMDLKYGITPTLTLDATYRTDFSHVEVDQEQVNLDRFPLFFPERRDFFIENSGTFMFGDVTVQALRTGASLSDFTLFHSRRIGLTPSGQRVPIHGGIRLSGRAGGFAVGMLNMQTEETLDRPAENFGVVRLRRDVLSNSDIGFLFANRQTVGGEDSSYNRSVGFDGTFRFFENLTVNSYLATVAAPGLDGDRTAGRILVGWRDRLWDTSVIVRRLGDDFQPGLGFVRRRGIYQYYATVGAHPRVPSLPFVQEVNPYLEINHVTDLASEVQTRQANGGFGVSFRDGANLSIRAGQQFERVLTPFQVTSGEEISAGEYEFSSASVGYSSNQGRPLAADFSLTHGGYFSGSRTSVSLGTVWRAGPRLSMRMWGSRNAISLPSGDFTADIASAAANYAFSAALLGTVQAQYNGATDQLITYSRLRVIHAPLSDLFLVLTHRRDLDTSSVLERSLTVKVTRLVGF